MSIVRDIIENDRTLQTNTEILDRVKTVDGTGSGLDADLWQGEQKDTLVASLRANVKIDGGGVISWGSNGYFNSTNRFIVISNGRGTFFAPTSEFDIVIPTSGTITGVGGAANITATSAGVPITGWQALYYILPIGLSNTSLPANFRIVSYSSDIVIPDNWVLIASQNADTGTLTVAGGKYTLHKGESIDTAKYSSAFVPNADTVDGVQGALLGVGGAGYTWVDETANRASGTTYTNTYGKPIMVSISIQTTTTVEYGFSVNGTRMSYKIGRSGTSSGIDVGDTIIVPSASTYNLIDITGSIEHWFELK